MHFKGGYNLPGIAECSVACANALLGRQFEDPRWVCDSFFIFEAGFQLCVAGLTVPHPPMRWRRLLSIFGHWGLFYYYCIVGRVLFNGVRPLVVCFENILARRPLTSSVRCDQSVVLKCRDHNSWSLFMNTIHGNNSLSLFMVIIHDHYSC